MPPPGQNQEVHEHQHINSETNKKEFEKKKAEFEARLKLTDEQKAKAKALREEGHKEMKPLMEAMRAKREELKASKTAGATKEELEKIQSDLRILDKKAQELRSKNMKSFEELLNSKQLKELEKMKEEGRKKFEQEHKNFKKRKTYGINPPPMPPKETR